LVTKERVQISRRKLKNLKERLGLWIKLLRCWLACW
jgi:hypothetical protein